MWVYVLTTASGGLQILGYVLMKVVPLKPILFFAIVTRSNAVKHILVLQDLAFVIQVPNQTVPFIARLQ